jgi:hypothetical protein
MLIQSHVDFPFFECGTQDAAGLPMHGGSQAPDHPGCDRTPFEALGYTGTRVLLQPRQLFCSRIVLIGQLM